MGQNNIKVHKNDAISTPLAEAGPWSTFWDLTLQFEGNDVENEIQSPLMTDTFSY